MFAIACKVCFWFYQEKNYTSQPVLPIFLTNMYLKKQMNITRKMCICLKLYLLIYGNQMIEIYMPMFVTNLLNFIPIPGIKCSFEWKKIPKENGGNKVLMEMWINSYVVTYYNPYFYGS